MPGARFDRLQEPDPADAALLEDRLGLRHRGPKIRCPKCNYEPRSEDRWFCSHCKQVWWNTFGTRGVCPACAYQWKFTACPRCHQWSLHEDWYEPEPPPKA